MVAEFGKIAAVRETQRAHSYALALVYFLKIVLNTAAVQINRH